MDRQTDQPSVGQPVLQACDDQLFLAGRHRAADGRVWIDADATRRLRHTLAGSERYSQRTSGSADGQARSLMGILFASMPLGS